MGRHWKHNNGYDVVPAVKRLTAIVKDWHAFKKLLYSLISALIVINIY